MVKVKICGITNLEDALSCFFEGSDAIGFVFYKKSPRYINPLKARNISRILPKKMKRVGVFVNEPAGKVKRIAKFCGLDILQFHGDESPGYCRKFKGYKIIKAFRIGENADLSRIKDYKTFAYLFDSYSSAKLGGTGCKFNWKTLKRAGRIKQTVFLSGGLNPANVCEAISFLKPDWLDVSSGLESRPGKKDHRKMKKFMGKIKNEKYSR